MSRKGNVADRWKKRDPQKLSEHTSQRPSSFRDDLKSHENPDYKPPVSSSARGIDARTGKQLSTWKEQQLDSRAYQDSMEITRKERIGKIDPKQQGAEIARMQKAAAEKVVANKARAAEKAAAEKKAKELKHRKRVTQPPPPRPAQPDPKVIEAQKAEKDAQLARQLGAEAHNVAQKEAGEDLKKKEYQKKGHDATKATEDAKKKKEEENIVHQISLFFHNPPAKKPKHGLGIKKKRTTMDNTFFNKITSGVSPSDKANGWQQHLKDVISSKARAQLLSNSKTTITSRYKDLLEELTKERKKKNSKVNVDKWYENITKVYNFIYQIIIPHHLNPRPPKKQIIHNKPGRQQAWGDQKPSAEPKEPVSKEPVSKEPVSKLVGKEPVSKLVGKEPEPVGRNLIVPKKKTNKYRVAHGEDWVLSQLNDETPLLKIRSTGYSEPYFQDHLPDEWFKGKKVHWLEGVDVNNFTAARMYALPLTKQPKIETKFPEGQLDLEAFFLGAGGNKCFEYDNSEEGHAMKEIAEGLINHTLYVRQGRFEHGVWYSNPGRNYIWKQYIDSKKESSDGSIWGEPSFFTRSGKDTAVKNPLAAVIKKIEKYNYNNFIIFQTPTGNRFKEGFIDLNGKIDVGNNWYMFELINEYHELHLKQEENKMIKKDMIPLMFFILKSDLKLEYKEADTTDDDWYKNRQILCEYEYRKKIVDELKKNDRMQKDIEKITDFNTTEKYCDYDGARYKEYTNICKHDPVKAKKEWQEKSHIEMEALKLGDKTDKDFRKSVGEIFKVLKMKPIIIPILNKETTKEDKINLINIQIEHIDVLRFRKGIPKAAAIPIPIDELENIKNSVIAHITIDVSDFIDECGNELEKITEMVCIENDNCCERMIDKIKEIISFINKKNGEYKENIKELVEYMAYFIEFIKLPQLSEDQKTGVQGFIDELGDVKRAFDNQWEIRIDSKELSKKLQTLIEKNFDQIIKFGEEKKEELEWVKLSKADVLEKITLMEEKKNKWENHQICLKTLVKDIKNMTINGKELKNAEMGKKIIEFGTRIQDITKSFNTVLSEYKEQHQEAITREREAAAKAAEEERHRLEAEKAAAEAADKERKEKELEKLAEIERKRKEEERLAEIERKRQELDDALIQAFNNFKVRLKEKQRKDVEDADRLQLIKMYNDAIKNNLKIKEEIEDLLRSLKTQEQILYETEKNSGYVEIYDLLMKDDANIIETIKAFKKETMLRDLEEVKTNLIARINDANAIKADYDDNHFPDKTTELQEFISKVNDQILYIDHWIKSISGDEKEYFEIIKELFDDEGKIPDDVEKKTLDEKIQKLNEVENASLPSIKNTLWSVKDEIVKKKKKLDDETERKTREVNDELNDIESAIKQRFEQYKALSISQIDINNIKDKYAVIEKILEDKMKFEEATKTIFAETEGEKLSKLEEIQRKIDAKDQEYTISKGVLTEYEEVLPEVALFDDINDVPEDTYAHLLERLEAVSLEDIEEQIIDKTKTKKRKLEIEINSHEKEFDIYIKIMENCGYRKNEVLPIKEVEIYDAEIKKLKDTELGNFLTLKGLMEIKLLKQKNIAILKRDGHEQELLAEKAKAFEEAAKKETEKIAKENADREAAAAAAILATTQQAAKDAWELANTERNNKIKEIELNITKLRQQIQEDKEKKEEEKEKAVKDRADWNGQQLRQLMRHVNPNFEDYDSGSTEERTDKYKKWYRDKNEGRTAEPIEMKDAYYKHRQKRVETWG